MQITIKWKEAKLICHFQQCTWCEPLFLWKFFLCQARQVHQWNSLQWKIAWQYGSCYFEISFHLKFMFVACKNQINLVRKRRHLTNELKAKFHELWNLLETFEPYITWRRKDKLKHGIRVMEMYIGRATILVLSIDGRWCIVVCTMSVRCCILCYKV